MCHFSSEMHLSLNLEANYTHVLVVDQSNLSVKFLAVKSRSPAKNVKGQRDLAYF